MGDGYVDESHDSLVFCIGEVDIQRRESPSDFESGQVRRVRDDGHVHGELHVDPFQQVKLPAFVDQSQRIQACIKIFTEDKLPMERLVFRQHKGWLSKPGTKQAHLRRL